MIKTPLLIGKICSQICGEKPLERVGKTGPKTLFKSCGKQPPNGPIYRAPKTSRWGLSDQSVDRPVDLNGHISDRCAIGRPVGRPRPGYRECFSLFGRPPGRPGPFQRAELSGRSTGSVGRPSCQNWRARLCTSVDRSVDRLQGAVDRPVDRLKPDQKN